MAIINQPKALMPINVFVLLSSSTNPPGHRKPVQNFPFQPLTLPVLAIAHNNDDCAGTPPFGAKQIVKKAVSSKRAIAQFFSGGKQVGQNPCRPMTHHTFFGLEQKVVAMVAKFIKEFRSKCD